MGSIALNTINRVAVIGLGYIGLPTAAILATNGIEVIGVDVNQRTVDAVNAGQVPFVEPDLGVHVAGAVSHGHLTASISTPRADAYIVAVPTPFKTDRSADLSYIEAAAEGIAPQLIGGELLILESTSPPGATEHMAQYILDLRPDLSLDGADSKPAILVAHCPERVLPGRVMIELVINDRIVGGITPDAAEKAKNLYSVFCKGEILTTDAVTAEMAKLVENSYRDVNIAFANELSVISDKLGIDVWELIRLANHHPRVNILQPGPGVGGHCIAVDPWFIVSAAPEEARLIRTAREVNDAKPEWVFQQVLSALELLPPAAEVSVLGLAFKANIDDLRESPAIEIAAHLAEALPSTRFNVAEPHVAELPAQLLGRSNVKLVPIDESVSRSDVIVVLVDHDDVKAIEIEQLEGKVVIDTRGALRREPVLNTLDA
ncbi:UDP-N-acetyl-D-mannosamine dehydrogenase [Paenarthrobacter aurescens]|uniref:UDP-N-acetyl-D-mannosamine dehydrogenase n=1 Tax=Paenarthrobacter aurescens TaxID=43663 RepID=UPI0026E1585E|nr:UDP-N-acetyl-D-mannosamine dehydrogenase [Paenarthrobacter aurescens]MDO6144550.1 UDP-N-acetyl-D-mannosamine dehydrogenase [Paenarthrobacter aurescens]MDO6148395.1 UDP-N-acetyl-D-mannosamine dehydrogenase [Paenarthrobacter aurescens]MDO6159641.1 UDP-N-acetyl-D-mannosamine dehydrogenase [Paenarthrobacter aurescens]MDO6164543.1 UDP-N-acetyl-D-mannosamine dehydrogenase [Paenarthrobacter aurescens]